MIFWIGILIAVIFAWTAIKLGFYHAWTLLFNIVIAVYLGVRLAPLIEDFVSMDWQYSKTLMVLATGLMTFLILHGICSTFLFGQFEVTFPRSLNVLGSGLFGFLAGFLAWCFILLVFCTLPISENRYVKDIVLGDKSFEETKMESYLGWWCNVIDTVVSTPQPRDDVDKAIKELLTKPVSQTAKSRPLGMVRDVNEPNEPNEITEQPGRRTHIEIPP